MGIYILRNKDKLGYAGQGNENRMISHVYNRADKSGGRKLIDEFGASNIFWYYFNNDNMFQDVIDAMRELDLTIVSSSKGSSDINEHLLIVGLSVLNSNLVHYNYLIGGQGDFTIWYKNKRIVNRWMRKESWKNSYYSYELGVINEWFQQLWLNNKSTIVRLVKQTMLKVMLQWYTNRTQITIAKFGEELYSEFQVLGDKKITNSKIVKLLQTYCGIQDFCYKNVINLKRLAENIAQIVSPSKRALAGIFKVFKDEVRARQINSASIETLEADLEEMLQSAIDSACQKQKSLMKTSVIIPFDTLTSEVQDKLTGVTPNPEQNPKDWRVLLKNHIDKIVKHVNQDNNSNSACRKKAFHESAKRFRKFIEEHRLPPTEDQPYHIYTYNDAISYWGTNVYLVKNKSTWSHFFWPMYNYCARWAGQGRLEDRPSQKVEGGYEFYRTKYKNQEALFTIQNLGLYQIIKNQDKWARKWETMLW